MPPQCKLMILYIVIYYKFHKNYREVCKNEFIIPLGQELKELYVDPEMCHSLRSLQTESVRPTLKMTDIA
jgi:ryanodine receptor 2